jgi:hypothetical protein
MPEADKFASIRKGRLEQVILRIISADKPHAHFLLLVFHLSVT